MSTKSKKTKQKSIITLIDTLLNTDLYHPTLVERTNRELNMLIYKHLSKHKNDANAHIYKDIKNVTDKLSILAHATIVQPIAIRSMSNQQFINMQSELRQLKSKLTHSK